MSVVIYVEYIPRIFCNSKQEKGIQRFPILTSDGDHYYILDEIMHIENLIYRNIDIDNASDDNNE